MKWDRATACWNKFAYTMDAFDDGSLTQPSAPCNGIMFTLLVCLATNSLLIFHQSFRWNILICALLKQKQKFNFAKTNCITISDNKKKQRKCACRLWNNRGSETLRQILRSIQFRDGETDYTKRLTTEDERINTMYAKKFENLWIPNVYYLWMHIQPCIQNNTSLSSVLRRSRRH